MRWMQAFAQTDDGKGPEKLSVAEAEAIIARLQRIADLQAQAIDAIEAAEDALDHSLQSCPALDERGDGTLGHLRAHPNAA